MVGAWEQGKARIVIGIPHTGWTSMEWAFGLRFLDLPERTVIHRQRGSPIDIARNNLAQAALDADAEWLMFIDSDTVPPPDAIAKLMAHDADIVSGLYYTRKDVILPCAYKYINGEACQLGTFEKNEVCEVDLVGMGCCLIHTRVFKNLPKPWFKWEIDSYCENKFGGVSEDFYFCLKAKEAGYKVIIDTGVECKHVHLVNLTEGKLAIPRA